MQVAVEFPYVLVQSLTYSSIFYSMASFEWNLWKFIWYIFFMYFTLLYFTFFGMMTISVTPNLNVAAIVAAPFFMLWNLFSGFMVPYMVIISLAIKGTLVFSYPEECFPFLHTSDIIAPLNSNKLMLVLSPVVQRIPIWWRWYYWANPIAWSLYGLLTSQYGDMDELVRLSDGVNSMPIKQLLRHQFGFRHDFLGVAGLVVAGFCILFASTFAFAIKFFNFQRR